MKFHDEQLFGELELGSEINGAEKSYGFVDNAAGEEPTLAPKGAKRVKVVEKIQAIK